MVAYGSSSTASSSTFTDTPSVGDEAESDSEDSLATPFSKRPHLQIKWKVQEKLEGKAMYT